MGLHVDVLGSEDLLRPLDRQRLGLVHELAPAVVPFPGVSLGVLVRQHGPGGLEDRLAHEVLGGDQLELVRLPLRLPANDVVDLGVGLFQEGHGRLSLCGRRGAGRNGLLDAADLVEPPGVSSRLERSRQEESQPPRRVVRGHRARAEDGDVGVVVHAGKTRRIVVVEDRGANPGNRLAVIDIPMPVPQMSTPTSAAPVETRPATAAA